jgi:hypothetical protein
MTMVISKVIFQFPEVLCGLCSVVDLKLLAECCCAFVYVHIFQVYQNYFITFKLLSKICFKNVLAIFNNVVSIELLHLNSFSIW